ncbi:hypothetical protein GALMADRAFT_264213, partial [Galerina marginata CBS 339.88]
FRKPDSRKCPVAERLQEAQPRTLENQRHFQYLGLGRIRLSNKDQIGNSTRRWALRTSYRRVVGWRGRLLTEALGGRTGRR